ncbi:proton-conducting transporter membrane subunit [Thiocapsa rosea]|uniref:Formate hydrogenlyase subunit 3/multisubunit Na+/H+ antiporter MnhD subunit n=1 Tax=Thiocapsa rosea TaxID=69360 RepID=A0A495VA34_9GAMM|nr:proton-conducting transporter membrane subunit [Thiocapsa rosea]RKT46179.1 formate hydrogenlyase subunit 3/multisubunit Na+/H+ antiporter MnhD subunit [Thiocapsa rosea]
MTWLLPLVAALPLLAAAFAMHRLSWWTPAVAAVPALVAALLVPIGESLDLPWLLLGAHFGLDEIGRIFLIFTSILWTAAGIHAVASMRGTPHVGRFNTFFLLAMAGNLWLIVGQDLVSFYVGFAVMGISSYGLVIHEGDRSALRAGKVYLVLTLGAELALFVALVMIASITGSILPTPEDLVELDDLAIGLLILGLAVKAGLIPLHVWLPLAHPAAPIPASAVLSGAMIKVALLGWLRFLPVGEVALPGWGLLFVFAGLATALYAAPIGILQSNPKVLLAYSSVGKMGLMAMTLGLMLIEPAMAPVAAIGLALYAGHHALTKGGLFLGVGLRKSSGLQGLVFGGLVLLALSMAAVPLTSGAVAKYGIKPIFVDSDWAWLQVAVALTTVATAWMMVRFVWSLKRVHVAGHDVLMERDPGRNNEVRAERASKRFFDRGRVAGWFGFGARLETSSADTDRSGRGSASPSMPRVTWALVGWVPLLGLVILYPLVLGSPTAWLTDVGLIALAGLLAIPVSVLAVRRPAALATLVDSIKPGDLLGLVRPLLMSARWTLRWSIRGYRNAYARVAAPLRERLTELARRPPSDLDRRLTAWPLAGGLWLGIMTLLIVLALVVPTQKPTFPRVDHDDPRPVMAPPTPSPAAPDAVTIAPAPLPDVTDDDPSVPPTDEPTDRPDALDPSAEPDAPVLDAPSRPIEPTESDIATSESPALEPQPAELVCDPDEPYVFRHAASDREVVLDRCISVDGTPQRLDAPPLSNALVLLIQTHLNARGFDAGPADGLIGPRTRDAIRRFQTDRGVAPTGAVTFDLLDRLREPD